MIYFSTKGAYINAEEINNYLITKSTEINDTIHRHKVFNPFDVQMRINDDDQSDNNISKLVKANFFL